MCKIFKTYRNEHTGNVYFLYEDDEGAGIKHLSGKQFAYAKKFKNMDFLNTVAKYVPERKMVDSYFAKEFTDPDVEYSADHIE